MDNVEKKVPTVGIGSGVKNVGNSVKRVVVENKIETAVIATIGATLGFIGGVIVATFKKKDVVVVPQDKAVKK